MKKRAVLSIVLLVSLMCFLTVTSYATTVCIHPTLGELYCEANHPHAYFRFCTVCMDKVYVGGYATKAHGTGEWGSGTCKTCGVHAFVNDSVDPEHPHPTISSCVCGEVRFKYSVHYSCSICTANKRTATGTTTKNITLLYLVDGFIMSAPMCLELSYRNTYNSPSDNDTMGLHGYPLFVTYSSSLTAKALEIPPLCPSVFTVANSPVVYYDNGAAVYSQAMGNASTGPATSTVSTFMIIPFQDRFPDYIIATCSCYASTGANTATSELSAAFTR